VVGRLGRPHGLDGFLGFYIEEEDAAMIRPGSTVFVNERPLVVRAIRRVDRGYQVAFEGLEDRFTAEEIRGGDVLMEERRELGESEYWPGDLIDLVVFDQDGTRLGIVKDVLFGPGQDRLLIEGRTGASFEVPFVDGLVPLVDIAAGRIEIVSIPGLTEQ